jgi:hypothetical protein
MMNERAVEIIQAYCAFYHPGSARGLLMRLKAEGFPLLDRATAEAIAAMLLANWDDLQAIEPLSASHEALIAAILKAAAQDHGQ